MVVITRRAFLASVVGALAAPVVAEAQQAGSSGWSPGSEGLGPGVSVRVIDENRERGSYTLHVRYPAGHTLGPHRHKSTEHVTVLSGTLLVGWGDVWDPDKLKEVRPGEFIEVPAGVVHFSAVREETVMEVRITGRYDIEYVLESDDPRAGKAVTIPAAGRQHPSSR
jgi:quercetin dioxygenase-like cupin family protein